MWIAVAIFMIVWMLISRIFWDNMDQALLNIYQSLARRYKLDRNKYRELYLEERQKVWMLRKKYESK